MEMKGSTLVLLLVAVFLLAATTTFLVYTYYVFQDRWEIPAEVIIDGRSGFQHAKEKLLFGNIAPGNRGRKFFNVTNTKEFSVDVKVGMEGPLSPWVSIRPASFTLAPFSAQIINLTMMVPEDTPYGNYSGTVTLLFLRDI